MPEIKEENGKFPPAPSIPDGKTTQKCVVEGSINIQQTLKTNQQEQTKTTTITKNSVNTNGQTFVQKPLKQIPRLIRITAFSIDMLQNAIYRVIYCLNHLAQTNSRERIDILIPTFAVGRVVGARGKAIKMLTDKYNSRFSLEKECCEYLNDHRKLTIEGRIDALTQATVEIFQIIEFSEIQENKN
eukprot:UN25775